MGAIWGAKVGTIPDNQKGNGSPLPSDLAAADPVSDCNIDFAHFLLLCVRQHMRV